MELVECILKYPVDGISITPDSLVDENRLSMGRGTITGRPMYNQMLKVVRDVYSLAKDKCSVKASGGIFTAKDAFDTLMAGASLVELVTGFIYEGWNTATNINLGLINIMDANNIENVQHLRGMKP